MLKKSITYRNLDGVEVTEDFYFNMSKAELVELEMSEEGGLRARLEKLGEDMNRAEIMKFVKFFIRSSIGRREGNRFVKSPEIADEFMQTGAYDELFMEMLNKPGEQARFIAAMMPGDLTDQVDVDAITRDAFAKYGVPLPEAGAQVTETVVEIPASIDAPAAPKKLEDYTHQELVDMPLAQWQALLSAHKGKLPKPLIVLAMQRANEE